MKSRKEEEKRKRVTVEIEGKPSASDCQPSRDSDRLSFTSTGNWSHYTASDGLTMPFESTISPRVLHFTSNHSLTKHSGDYSSEWFS